MMSRSIKKIPYTIVTWDMPHANHSLITPMSSLLAEHSDAINVSPYLG